MFVVSGSIFLFVCFLVFFLCSVGVVESEVPLFLGFCVIVVNMFFGLEWLDGYRDRRYVLLLLIMPFLLRSLANVMF